MKKCFFFVMLVILSCKKETIPDPDPAQLVGPENNNTCTTAIVLNLQQSQVNFSWQEAQHTNLYELVVRDILTSVDQKKETDRLFSAVTLDRGKPYAWWVNSISDQTETITKSQVWTFYLEGDQSSSHFPFPAKLVSPAYNAQVSLEGGTYLLRWEAVDLDNDIENYDLYLGADPEELALVAEKITTPSKQVSLNSNQYYYWKVLTRDGEGNVSHSAVGVFKTSP